MLISKEQDTPYIAIFKLISGDEFICKVVHQSDIEYVVSKPLTIAQTEQGLRFVPVVMMAELDENFKIPRNIVIVGKPAKELENQYQSATSGILLPKSGSSLAL